MFIAGVTAAAGFVLLVAAIFVFDNSAVLSTFLAFLALASLFIHSRVLCPRCKLHVYSKDGFRAFGETLPNDCSRCGRSRRGVWPFQYLIAPETRDGVE